MAMWLGTVFPFDFTRKISDGRDRFRLTNQALHYKSSYERNFVMRIFVNRGLTVNHLNVKFNSVTKPENSFLFCHQQDIDLWSSQLVFFLQRNGFSQSPFILLIYFLDTIYYSCFLFECNSAECGATETKSKRFITDVQCSAMGSWGRLVDVSDAACVSLQSGPVCKTFTYQAAASTCNVGFHTTQQIHFPLVRCNKCVSAYSQSLWV
jgi:hypothetical protein